MNDEDKELFEHINNLEQLFKQILVEGFTPSDLFYATGLPQVETYQLFNLLNAIAIENREEK